MKSIFGMVGCSLVNLLDNFRTPFPKNTSVRLFLFITVKASENLNLMKNMSTQWNRVWSNWMLEEVTIEWRSNRMFGTKHSKINRLQKTIEYQKNWTKCKIFEFKYGNRKLSIILKYNQVKLVLAVFASTYWFVLSQH